jgi:hypothetical protein
LDPLHSFAGGMLQRTPSHGLPASPVPPLDEDVLAELDELDELDDDALPPAPPFPVPLLVVTLVPPPDPAVVPKPPYCGKPHEAAMAESRATDAMSRVKEGVFPRPMEAPPPRQAIKPAAGPPSSCADSRRLGAGRGGGRSGRRALLLAAARFDFRHERGRPGALTGRTLRRGSPLYL